MDAELENLFLRKMPCEILLFMREKETTFTREVLKHRAEKKKCNYSSEPAILECLKQFIEIGFVESLGKNGRTHRFKLTENGKDAADALFRLHKRISAV